MAKKKHPVPAPTGLRRDEIKALLSEVVREVVVEMFSGLPSNPHDEIVRQFPTAQVTQDNRILVKNLVG